MFLGFLVLVTALSISAVAIYYSVAGLVAIFAAATVPIIIMGGALEIGKLVTAVWLHRYWREATWWLKTYLSVAVVVLMFITSMGIFGFLSRAHIEQTAEANQSVQEIQQIEDQILREQSVIERANLAIEGLRSQGSNRDQEIQEQIDLEQQRIDTAYERIEPAIQEQRAIIEARQTLREQRAAEVEAEIESARQGLNDLDAALAAGDVRRAQSIVGTRADGAFGPGTERAINRFREENQAQITPLQQRLETIRTEVDTQEQAARDEIARLRQFAEQQIQDSNNLIARLRAQIGTENADTVQQQIQEQQDIIDEANITVDSLIERKYALETEYRLLEAEVGPVKYLAEFIYGDVADNDLLEEAVRWVIVIIIFVFDPLAVLLLIASQYTFEIHKRNRMLEEDTETESLENWPVKENKNDTDRSDTIGSNENEHTTDTGAEPHSDRGTDNKGEDSEQGSFRDNIGTGAEPQGRVLPERVDVPTETVNPVSVANSYKSKKKIDTESTEELKTVETKEEAIKTLSLEEQRALEYKQKEETEEFNNDKEAWKHDHPEQTLKMYKTLYINGKIDKLPWEGYRQNSEQSDSSLFSKLQNRIPRDES